MSTDDIIQLISQIHIPGFFITVDFTRTSEEAPRGIEEFLKEKHKAIHQGLPTRKFAFRNAGWHMVFTFFPTDAVVEERYAMKNKMIKK